MKWVKMAVTAGAMAVMSAQAGVTAEEAAQLGKTMTPFGSEIAGNAAGTIPPYTGGLTKAPAGWDAKSGNYPDPFKDEKPLYTITPANMAEHADKLSEGTKALLQRYPDTFRVNVYPSHRTVAYPQYVLDNTVKNATNCSTKTEGLELTEGCIGGLPFPIPKTGTEGMWNHLLRFGGYTYSWKAASYYVDANGRQIMTQAVTGDQEYPYYKPGATSAEDYWWIKSLTHAPSRVAGESTLLKDPINQVTEGGRKAWQYLPGQRRVRLAPDLSYDTPLPASGGAAVFDDVALFAGAMDRFDWKLLGKREMVLPYNSYKVVYGCSAKELITPNHFSPDCTRWELQRVWVIEATLKPGARHVYHKRLFYFDEDSWNAGMSDQYDAAGKLYRVGFNFVSPRWDVPAPTGDVFATLDLSSGLYMFNSHPGPDGYFRDTAKLPDREWSPDSISGRGVR